MITSQTLGTTLYPVSLGGELVETAVEIARGAAARLAGGPDRELLSSLGADAAALDRLLSQPASPL
ncbi:hypothetical protein AB0E81_35875 [Streptomyces sp. NPDC033538]|uniref:hypothetical protein n=1 Tax=Streptomyces sp. NPDC033538 TaxID=3155367 RepID=UPI0033EAC1C6